MVSVRKNKAEKLLCARMPTLPGWFRLLTGRAANQTRFGCMASSLTVMKRGDLLFIIRS